MSRREKYGERFAIAFGVDHAMGNYVMVWDRSDYDEPDVENVVVDEDRFTGAVTPDRIISLGSEYGVPLGAEEVRDFMKAGVMGGARL